MNFTSIIVHPGVFHADDAMAVAILRFLNIAVPVRRCIPTEEEQNDQSVIKIDVGGVCNVCTSAYDHHQRGGAGERDTSEGYGIDGHGNPLASAGLIWNMFPYEICSAEVHSRVDAELIRGIDAADCGVGPTALGASPSISRCVSWMNPSASASAAERDEAFDRAVALCGTVLNSCIEVSVSFVEARDTVLSAEVDGQVLPLDKFVPWNEHIFKRVGHKELLYVVYPSERGGFCLQQIPKEPGSFEGRKPLPEAWAGLREDSLREVTGVDDATFCHTGRFIGGAESLNGALELCRLAIAE